MAIELEIIPCLSDNYMYLIHWDNDAIIIDPPEVKPVLRALKKKNLKLQAILNTHHHSDHTAGNVALAQATGAKIIGPNDERIPGLTHFAKEGDILRFGPLQLDVMFMPGHTKSHIVFYAPQEGWLFSGDVMFCGGGCGRLFEGTPEQMHTSLSRINGLPTETKIYCGHEYTLTNLRFALSLEPENPTLLEAYKKAEETRKQDKPTIPTTLTEERKVSPFLRSSDPVLKAAIGRENSSDLETFTYIRELKDNF